MRRMFHLGAMAVAVVSLALWFFGGMQSETRLMQPAKAGVSRTAPGEVAPAPAPADGMAALDFRPGLDFLAVSWLVAGGLWWLGGRWPGGEHGKVLAK